MSAYIGVVGTLLGVIVGLFGGEVTRIIREKLRIRRLKRILKEELKSVLKQFPCKEHVINQARLFLKTKSQFLNPSSVLFITSCYQRHFSELYEHLPEKQRATIHIIYEQLIEADNILKGMEDKFLGALRDGIIKDSYKMCEDRLDNVLTNYKGTKELIEKFLKGEDYDPFKLPKEAK